MKQKTLLILMIICLMGFLSSAKQEGKKCCCNKSAVELNRPTHAEVAPSRAKEVSDLALPPLRLLRFDI